MTDSRFAIHFACKDGRKTVLFENMDVLFEIFIRLLKENDIPFETEEPGNFPSEPE